MKQQFSSALQKFESYINEQKGTDLASQTAAQLKTEYGVEVTASELKEAASKTGIADFEAAWLKVNKENLKKGLFKAGEVAAKQSKPNSPTGQTRTFDISAPGMTADKIFKLLSDGFQPKE